MEPTKDPSNTIVKSLTDTELLALDIYRKNLEPTYALVRKFLNDDDSVTIVKEIASAVFETIPEAGYHDFAHLVFFRIVFKKLQDNQTLFTISQSTYTFEELFTYYMKSDFGFSDADIASICETSIGTIRLRLSKNYLDLIPKNHSHKEIPQELKDAQPEPIFIKKNKHWSFNFNHAPWYYKIIFEGLLATTLVLSIVFSVPRIKKIYEFWVERRLDLYSLTEFNSDALSTDAILQPDNQQTQTTTPTVTTTTPTAGATTPVTSAPDQHPTVATNSETSTETEFVGKESERLSSDKIYRVLIQTDSLESSKALVVNILTAHEHQYAFNATGPSELPGGIIFDIFVPFKSYKPLVNQLGSVGETKIIITRSKEKGVIGKARVKIWLQRI